MYRARGLRGRAAMGAFRALHMTGADVRKNFLEYFKERAHEIVKSSPVVPLCDPTVPFVNAGMNQFKGVFLGRHTAPHPRVVNSQKCIRVGGKHNDLAVVGSDGTHHTMFEMLGNWSFGDYYKEDACRLAWGLLTGPYRLSPEQLVVTYFAGDTALGLREDAETRDVWRHIGVRDGAIRALGAADNFWEMGATGPCGPCTEIHHAASDGTLTEIWNLVFIQYNRESDGAITPLPRRHVDTGMGLERVTALLQGAPSNYDTDLFLPIIKAIEKESRQRSYSGKFGSGSEQDAAYRCLADHARMLAVCLADGMLPAVSLNVKQIMRKSFRLSEEAFKVNSGLLCVLYDRVAEILGSTYPELHAKSSDAKIIIEHEENSYRKLRSDLAKKWKDLSRNHPEVENLSDVEVSGFVEGYKQFKQAMSSAKTDVIPAEVVFKMYDTHGFTEDIIERVAALNKYTIDKDGFQKLLQKHRSKHKSSFKEQAESKSLVFDRAIEKLNQIGVTETNDNHKYKYTVKDNEIIIPDLKTEILAILNSSGEYLQSIELSKDETLYIVTQDTNFYCEEGGQTEDRGKIIIDDSHLDVINVFKIRNIIFHKVNTNGGIIKLNDSVNLRIDRERRLDCMRNHTATHLLNAAIRKVLPKSVISQVGSSVTEGELVLNLAVYGEKLSQEIVLEAENLVREAIESDSRVETTVTDSVGVARLGDVVTVPGEVYPDTDLRLVEMRAPRFTSRELCCGTHVPSAGHVGEVCVTRVQGAGGHAPTLRAVTGPRASEVMRVYKRACWLERIENTDARHLSTEMEAMRARLERACGPRGPAFGLRRRALDALDRLRARVDDMEVSLSEVAAAEVREAETEAARAGRRFLVHFLLSSYLMESAGAELALAECRAPAMLLGCANGVIHVACTVPQSYVTKELTAARWLGCVLPVFDSELAPTDRDPNTFAAMVGTKVSLTDCENLVRDAMRVAIMYAEAHTKKKTGTGGDKERNRTHS